MISKRVLTDIDLLLAKTKYFFFCIRIILNDEMLCIEDLAGLYRGHE